MVTVSINTVLIVVGFVLVIGLMIENRMRLNSVANDFADRLNIMERALEVVAGVLQELPNLVPQFSINQNPLSQILEFFTSVNQPEEPSYDGGQLREGNGQFSNGEKEVEVETAEK